MKSIIVNVTADVSDVLTVSCVDNATGDGFGGANDITTTTTTVEETTTTTTIG